MFMNRKSLTVLLRNALLKLSLDTLQDIRKRLNAGELMNLFDVALDSAIESKIADKWQQENQIGV